MATVEQLLADERIERLAPSEGIVLKDVPWALYEALRDVEENWHIKMTYDDGALELMSPSNKHESIKKRIGRLIETMTAELHIPVRPLGSTTWKADRSEKKGGLEADECCYILNERFVRECEEIDLALAPPPDLAVEAEVSRRAVPKEPIYARLGVPEVWRCDGKSLRSFQLIAGEYVENEMSLNLPFLRVADLMPFVKWRPGAGGSEWIQEFQTWARSNFADQIRTSRSAAAGGTPARNLL